VQRFNPFAGIGRSSPSRFHSTVFFGITTLTINTRFYFARRIRCFRHSRLGNIAKPQAAIQRDGVFPFLGGA
jgi:hypothetical protein